jgi:hypothetical protein
MAHNGHGHGQLHAPNEDDIDDDLWNSPSKRDINSKASTDEQSGSAAGGPQVRTGKSKYEDGESKEAILRNELESVRKVNEAIEGVIESLDKAKSSMRVSLPVFCPLMCVKFFLVVCQSNSQFSFHSPEHVDAHTVPDRAQSKADPKPCVARSQPGSC